MCVCVSVLVAQLCPTLCNPMDCSLPGFSVHEILQARTLEWVVVSFSRESSWSKDQTWVSHIQADSLLATQSSILAWRIPWTEEPGGLQSTGLQRFRHDWVTNRLLHLGAVNPLEALPALFRAVHAHATRGPLGRVTGIHSKKPWVCTEKVTGISGQNI